MKIKKIKQWNSSGVIQKRLNRFLQGRQHETTAHHQAGRMLVSHHHGLKKNFLFFCLSSLQLHQQALELNLVKYITPFSIPLANFMEHFFDNRLNSFFLYRALK